MKDEAADSLLQIRATLGRWTKDTKWYVINCIQEHPLPSGREYQIEESRGSYNMPFIYKASESQLIGILNSLQKQGFQLTKPEYPELQEYFRNGKPITAFNIVSDAMEGMKVDENPMDGIDFLMEHWKKS